MGGIYPGWVGEAYSPASSFHGPGRQKGPLLAPFHGPGEAERASFSSFHGPGRQVVKSPPLALSLPVSLLVEKAASRPSTRFTVGEECTPPPPVSLLDIPTVPGRLIPVNLTVLTFP